jgi:hypothetical protein
VTSQSDEGGHGDPKPTIGMWGAPASGKTTFLAALYSAAIRSPSKPAIYGTDTHSNEFLIGAQRMLSRDRRFPGSTQAVEHYNWTVDLPATGPPGGARPVSFGIDLQDAPGWMYRSGTGASRSRLDIGDQALAEDQMLDYLVGCAGLLLLIDPVREQESGDAHEYFQGTVLKMAQRIQGGKLPHHVAVCITKFDHPRIYEFARKHYYCLPGQQDPRFPRVHDQDARQFFLDLCKKAEKSDVDLICNALGRFFHHERVRYFVTSAIGFRASNGKFREEDPYNTEQTGGGVMIRGPVYPINVLEPILWLGRGIAAG